MLGYVNELRASNGLSALSLNSGLNSSAKSRAQAIPNNFTANDGENIAKDASTLRAIFNKWCDSSTYTANMLRDDITTFGFGYYTNGKPSLFGVGHFG